MHADSSAGDAGGQGLAVDRSLASEVDRSADAVSRPTRERHTRALFWLLMAVAAWAVPVAAYVLGVAWLLPPLVVLITASLLRIGRCLLDRLVPATMLLVGAACAAGLLWTVWPWGLHPVPVGGFATTALLVVAAITGRRPHLPKAAWTDTLIAGAAVALSALYAWPYLTADGTVGRLATALAGEDNARHQALFEVIGRRGYLFADRTAAAGDILTGMIFYPQGWHLNAAVLEAFRRGPDPAQGGLYAFQHYLAWLLGTQSLLLITMIWAAVWIAGHRTHMLQRVIIVVSLASLAVVSEIPRLLASGYPSEMLGLAFAIVLVAVVVRPVARIREQSLLLGALTVGIAFTYYFFLIPAVPLLVLWFVAERQRWRDHRGLLVATAGVATLVAATPATLGLVLANQAEHLIAQVGGQPNVMACVVMLVIVVGGLAARPGQPFPHKRRYLHALIVCVAFPLVIAAGNLVAGTSPRYYFGKSIHLLVAVLIIGVGAVVRLLPVPGEASDGLGIVRSRRIALATVSALSVPAIALFGVYGPGGLFLFHLGMVDTTWTGAWLNRYYENPLVATIVNSANRTYPAVPGTMTLIFDKGLLNGYRETLMLSTLQGTTAQTQTGIYNLPFTEPDRTRLTLERAPGRVRIVIANEAALPRVEGVLRDQPELGAKVEIVPLPGVKLPRTTFG
jgi:hypothetical protein